MSKFVTACDFTFRAGNYAKGYPIFYVTIPLSFSLLDLLNIIRAYTDYTGEYEYDFYSVYHKTYYSSKYRQNELDNIEINEFMDISPSMICSFGSLKIEISKRGKSGVKWSKIYPEAFMGSENFPEEKEFKKLKNISSEKVAEFFKKNSGELAINYYHYLPAELQKPKKENFKEYNEKLKEIFKNKYKMSDEKYEKSEEINSIWNCNKIIRK